MVPHWNVSTKSIVKSRWFFVDRQFRIRILTFMGRVSVYVQSINCLTRWTTHLWTPVDTFSKKEETWSNSQPPALRNRWFSTKIDVFQNCEGSSTISRDPQKRVFCRESLSTTRSGSSLLYKLHKVHQFTPRCYWEWCFRNPRDFHHQTMGVVFSSLNHHVEVNFRVVDPNNISFVLRFHLPCLYAQKYLKSSIQQ